MLNSNGKNDFKRENVIKYTKNKMENETRTGPGRNETRTRGKIWTGNLLRPGLDQTGTMKTQTGGENVDEKKKRTWTRPDQDIPGS